MSTENHIEVPEHIILAVKHGAAFLDERKPGWEHRLDLNSLELNNNCSCVLGQLSGSYLSGLQALGLPVERMDFNSDTASGEPVDLGFYAGDPASGDQWEQLTEAWRREVHSRVTS